MAFKFGRKKADDNSAAPERVSESSLSNEVVHQGTLRRYMGLIISILGLVLLFAVVIVQDMRIANHARANTARIQAAQKINQYSREIIRDIFDAQASYGEDTNSPHMRSLLTRMQNNTNGFTKIIATLKDGGTDTQLDGSTAHIEANKNEEVKKYLATIDEYWKPLQEKLQAYLAVADDIMSDSSDELESAMTQAKTSNLNLTESADGVIRTVQQEVTKNAKFQSQLQSGAIAAVIIYFLFITYFVIYRSLSKADREAAIARRETDEIMGSVQEGLFLIGEDLRVGHQQSNALKTILPGVEMGGQDFEAVLDNVLSKTDIENTKSYIRQLFKPRVKESLIKSLNPLNRIQVFIDDKQGGLNDRFLRFDFNRVFEDKEIKRVLVSVTDITESVLLEQRLEKEREQNNRQVEMLVKVLRVDPDILAGYMRRGDEVAEKINTILRNPNARGSHGLRAKIDEIFREIHAFKGESSALEFDRFVVIAEEMENKLKELRGQQELAGDDFLAVAVSLDAMMEQLNITRSLQQRLITHATQGAGGDEAKTLQNAAAQMHHGDIDQYLKQYAEQVAERNYKLVEAVVEGFSKAPFDEKKMDMIKSVAVQLIRNAMVHGIETPEARKAKGKSRQGHLGVSLIARDGFYDLIVEDDGKGIDIEAIRDKLRQLPDFNKNPDEMTREELYRAIFVTGMSTATMSTEDAGRGVGMDVVRDRIKSLNGKLAIKSEPGQFTRFTIRLIATGK